MTGKPLLDPTTVATSVRARAINLVGNYAIKSTGRDGHTAGIYNFRTLRADCPCDECQKLRAAGKTPGA